MKLLCLGDSLTDCGRLFDAPPLGSGYVHFLSDLLNTPPAGSNTDILHPENQKQSWEVRNLGVDGFTVARLLENAPGRYLGIPADLITILIGINDIGLMMNTDRTKTQKDTMMQAFFQKYDQLLRILSTKRVPVLLMEPFLFPCPAEYLSWFPLAEEMSQGISCLAKKYSCPYLLLHRDFNERYRESLPHSLTTDGIHLTEAGHRLLAHKVYDCICRLNLV